MDFPEEPINEIAIPAYGVIDPQQKRKIFETTFSINMIAKIRRDLICLYFENSNEATEKEENEALISFFKTQGISYLWESFINTRNVLAHPSNSMTVKQFKSLILNTKRLTKFIKSSDLLTLCRQILVRLESLDCLVENSNVTNWRMQPRRTPTNRKSEHLYVYRPSGQQIFRNDIVFYQGKEYIILCGKGGDFDNPRLLTYENGKRDNEMYILASDLQYRSKI